MSEPRHWWRDAVIYQIYPRSFQDSDGDGIGDLAGITERLDYLRALGVDALWLSPIYPSPMRDFGYDVSDYTAISPEFGTMADFRALLSAAHERGLRILLDLVMNHTSDQHPWFLESMASRENPKREWYLWRDGKPGVRGRGRRPAPPNNWRSVFGGSAWQWDERTDQYYLHSFLKEQPDLNWRDPELRAAMMEVIRYWLEMGVDGFRLDVANCFMKDEMLRDNPRRAFGLRPYDRQRHLYDFNQLDNLDVMRQIRATVDAYTGRVSIGEIHAPPRGDTTISAAYYANGAGLHMAFDFAFLFSPWRANAFAAAIDRWERALDPDHAPFNWPNYTLSNHDQPRAISRYASGNEEETLARARMAAALLLTLRGTPFIYYGEEIGIRNGRIPRSRIQDPFGKPYWPIYKGRDGERTPMQWSAELQGGFTSEEPWLPVNPDSARVNVAAQQDEPKSLLHWYRALIALRKREVALRAGGYRRLSAPRSQTLCYLRETEGDRIFVALNFARNQQTVALPDAGAWRVLLSSHHSAGETLDGKSMTLPGYGVVIARTV
ncbi:MAG TPA: alpha-amylase family glycosyl hydrolase [Ktedonobacterales bacterium]